MKKASRKWTEERKAAASKRTTEYWAANPKARKAAKARALKHWAANPGRRKALSDHAKAVGFGRQGGRPLNHAKRARRILEEWGKLNEETKRELMGELLDSLES